MKGLALIECPELIRRNARSGREYQLDTLETGRSAERLGSMTAMRHRPRIKCALVNDSNRCRTLLPTAYTAGVS